MILKKPIIYDFSSWEDNIQWDQIKAQDPLAVIMRASYQSLGARTRYEDVKAFEYMKACKDREIRTGLYHFLTPNGIAEQAALFISVWNKCGGAEVDPIVDVEVDLVRSYPHATRRGESSIGQAVWQGHVKTFIDLIATGTGRTPIIYTSENFWKFVMTKNSLLQLVPPTWTADYPLWVAQYPLSPDTASQPAVLPKGWTSWAMWQYSDTGRQNGFLANDLNTASPWYEIELLGTEPPPPPPDPDAPPPYFEAKFPGDPETYFYDKRSK
jgi:GH25 family lysozyme M1 (1,4-beta-N-acetylmuramidase)